MTPLAQAGSTVMVKSGDPGRPALTPSPDGQRPVLRTGTSRLPVSPSTVAGIWYAGCATTSPMAGAGVIPVPPSGAATWAAAVAVWKLTTRFSSPL